MHPDTWRKQAGLTRRELAIQLELRSPGRLADLINGRAPWPTDLAIRIDRLTHGAVPVRALRPDLSDVRVIQPEARP